MNLLNYVDRWVPSAVKPLLQKDLELSDTQTSVPVTAFIVVYMLASPVFGSLADKWPRKVVIAAGVALWSLATGAAAFATGFFSFLAARALVGVGEAAYATLSPALLSDFYPPSRRSRVLTFFYVAMPVGSALGFAAGGFVGEHWGWRAAFLVCGLPGVLAAFLALRIRDPGRGTFDADAAEPPRPWGAALRELVRNPTYVCTVAGYTAVAFGTGVMADWYSTFLHRERGMKLDAATSLMGIIVVSAGIAGTAFGGWLGERFVGRTRQPYLAMSAATMLAAAALSVPALTIADPLVAVGFAGASQFFLWCYNGPVNALLVNCVPSALRVRAFSLSILVMHALGDAISPPIAGAVSDASGSLPVAMLLAPATLAVGALVWLAAWRRAPEPPAVGSTAVGSPAA
jgi:predicted MFS family arabinose efflux permease